MTFKHNVHLTDSSTECNSFWYNWVHQNWKPPVRRWQVTERNGGNITVLWSVCLELCSRVVSQITAYSPSIGFNLELGILVSPRSWNYSSFYPRTFIFLPVYYSVNLSETLNDRIDWIIGFSAVVVCLGEASALSLFLVCICVCVCMPPCVCVTTIVWSQWNSAWHCCWNALHCLSS